MSDKQVVIIGAGPAGLTMAYELTQAGIAPIVLEQLDKVGGIARTESYRGFYFDMGGHRFFSKAENVNALWHKILGADFLLRPRLSRIYYNHKFFHYPLKPLNTLVGFGFWQALLVGFSFIKWQIFPYKDEDTFEEWVTNRFGQRLFRIFFKTYTEKVWGISTSELKAEWAAQRIKDLSLRTALLAMFVTPEKQIKTLIEEFRYPRRGPGMFWGRVKEEIERGGGVVRLNSQVVKICRTGAHIDSVVITNDQGKEEVIRGTHFISSMPLPEFVQKLDAAPRDVLEAAHQLTHRHFLTVCLIVNQANLFDDNWIYVHSPEVKVGRIQNFKNWSPEMVPDPTKTSLGLEYFWSEGDALGSMSDAELLELGKQEIERIGLAKYADVEAGVVFRVPNAYPVYDSAYRGALATVRKFMEGLENCQTIGRNGLHRYDNQDHAMITGMLAARNLVLGEKNDLWSINTEGEYHEEVREQVVPPDVERVFLRVDPVAFGASIGITAGLGLFLITLFGAIKNDPFLSARLQLLSQFFFGYTVTIQGSFLGMFYAFWVGAIGGWAVAFLRNITLYVSVRIIHRDIEKTLLEKLLDYM